ncbi:MAG TPA: LON peptidase substrate-binding domain-containing protein [Holophagaceae bacterium]|nr:LON peptidase substrate-binding domain-containing protein [Holophagaceae bacterium]
MLPALLPLFPLPRVVLFPHTFLPLHIFEPRYRQMTAECLASHQHFILALTRAHEGPDLVPVASATFGTGCLARIVKTEALPDGRFNILVQGRQAVRIKEEPSNRPFRQSRWEPEPFDGEAPWPEDARGAFTESLFRFADRFDLTAQVKQLLDLDLAPAVLLNTLAMALDLDPVEKQFLLEAPGLLSLADRFHQVLDFTLHGRDMPGGSPA